MFYVNLKLSSYLFRFRYNKSGFVLFRLHNNNKMAELMRNYK